MIFATLSMANGDLLPYGYLRVSNAQTNKFLIRSLTANYSETFLNPLILDGVFFTPKFTNTSGIVEFNDLAFSIYGPSGKYQITYVCDGLTILSQIITV